MHEEAKRPTFDVPQNGQAPSRGSQRVRESWEARQLEASVNEAFAKEYGESGTTGGCPIRRRAACCRPPEGRQQSPRGNRREFADRYGGGGRRRHRTQDTHSAGQVGRVRGSAACEGGSEASIPPASTPERSGRERTGSGRTTGFAGADSTAASGGHNKNV
jgi:hypothetical protein